MADSWGGSWGTSWGGSWGGGGVPPPPPFSAGTDAFEAIDRKAAKRRKDEREDREELRRLIVEAMDPKAVEPVVMVASERVARLSTGTEFHVPQNIDFAQLVKDITAAVVGQVQMGVKSPPPERPFRLTRKQRKDDDEILLLF